MRRYWKQAVVIIFMVVAVITPTMDNFINNLEKRLKEIEDNRICGFEYHEEIS